MLGNLNFAPPTEAWPKAKAAVEKALALDDHLPRPTPLATMVAFWYDWDWVAAEAGFNRILALNPGDAFTHGNYAWFLLNRRRFDECLHEIKVAIDLDPLMPFLYAWSVGLHCATGRLDDALRDFERAIEIDPTFGLPYFHAGLTYLRKGMPEKAIEVIERGTKIAGHPGWGDGVIADVRLGQGDRDGARRRPRRDDRTEAARERVVRWRSHGPRRTPATSTPRSDGSTGQSTNETPSSASCTSTPSSWRRR